MMEYRIHVMLSEKERFADIIREKTYLGFLKMVFLYTKIIIEKYVEMFVR